MAIRKRNIPPRILRLLQQQQQPIPPRILKQRSNLPPRILKLRQEELEAQTSLKEAHRIVREIPVGYYPDTRCSESALLQLQRASMERLVMLQQEVLLEQQAVLMEQQFMIQERQVLLELQALMMEQQLMIQEQEVQIEQQAVMMEQQFKIQEQLLVQQKKVKENLAEESTVDYSRLTSFLEKDDSFLTPWSWKPEEKQTTQSRPEPCYSFNLMNPPSKNLKI